MNPERATYRSSAEAQSDGGVVGRFAPSTTGRAHPGTLLAALLCWLDGRARGGRVILRLEDLDPQRCTAELTAGLQDDLGWFGLDWDVVEVQSGQRARHEAALDQLAAAGLLYPCTCSRKEIQAHGRRAPDGGWIYPGTCREQPLPAGDWRAVDGAVRCRLPGTAVVVDDMNGGSLGGPVAEAYGDPVLRRRDGAIAYHLAAVVDDAASGVTDVVRGRDLATCTGIQVLLQGLLGLPQPRFRHHLLLLEPRGDKLAKFHGSVGADVLRQRYNAAELCGILAQVAGLQDDMSPVTPQALLSGFRWDRVAIEDRTVDWDGHDLRVRR